MNQRVVSRQVGGLDQIEVLEEIEPVPKAGEAKVRIHAAGAATAIFSFAAAWLAGVSP